MTDVLDCFKDCPVVAPGWRMLIGQLPPKKKSEGGIIIPDSADTARAQELLGCISQVVKMGELCYEGDHCRPFEERKAFNNGLLIENGYNVQSRNWVNVGDWVIHGPHVGLKLPMVNPEDREEKVIYRFINDDEILGVITDLDDLLRRMPILTYHLTT